MDADWNEFLKVAHVLILDDSQMFRTATAGMLYKIGFRPEQVHQAADAVSAWRLCRSRTMDLILCDYNLGGGADGLSFFDQLQSQGLLRATTLFVIVTGDANTSVFLSFAEHSPDDYLIKPINFAAFRERLVRVHSRKRLLGPIQQALADNRLDDAEHHLEQAIVGGPALASSLDLLRGRLLLARGQADAAYNLLTSSQLRSPDDNVRLELARLMWQLGRGSQALGYLDAITSRGPVQLQGLLLRATIQISQRAFAAAFETLEQTLKLAGDNSARHYQCGFLAMIGNRSGDALSHFDGAAACQQAAMQPDPRPLLQAIRLRLDSAQHADEKLVNGLVMEIGLQLKELRTQFAETKEVELLIKCRLRILAGNISEAQQHLASYLASCQGDDGHKPDLLDQIDCAKCQFNLCRFDDAMATLQQARKLLPASDDHGSEALLLTTHLGQMTAQMSEARKRALEIRKRGIAALHSNNPITAVENLLQAIRLMPSDADSAFQLFMALGQAWPRGYSINQTARLALRLQKVIQMSALAKDGNYRHHSATLAAQLQMPELAER
ncbi:MAG: response regulator [Gammaproteobacteria bacterium]|nr:response regulator [Gammaproteobacteria bacterium]